MGDYRYRKAQFYSDLVQTGVTSEKNLPEFGWDTPKEKLAKWLRQFSRQGQLSPVPKMDRLVNHFTIGADPEFVFTRAGAAVHANTCQFRTGRAYGADQNGRLVEIRPYAYRSALRVLASIHATLRWMCLTHPNVQDMDMIAGAFQFQDGLGGHVHVGRKRLAKLHKTYVAQNRGGLTPEDVRALDNICTGLIELGVFPRQECLDRRRGDARGQIYGALGDIRLQKHGYEYRTYPSWLDNPWLTYFVLVLTKLTVHDPFLIGQELMGNNEKSRRRITNLLAYYKGRDDDAALAYNFLSRHGFPRHNGGDFRARWGLVGYAGKDLRKSVQYVPSAIKAPAEGIKELWDYFVQDKPIKKAVVPEITWSPANPPAGYAMMLDRIETTGQKGIGEALCDVVECTKEVPRVTIRAASVGGMLTVSADIVKHLATNWREQLAKATGLGVSAFAVDTGHNGYISIAAHYREHDSHLLRKALVESGVFPIWRMRDVKPDSHQVWLNRQKSVPKKVEMRQQLKGSTIGEYKYNIA